MRDILRRLVPALSSVLAIAFIGLVGYASLTFTDRQSQQFGILGSGASILGIGYTLYQVRETKRLAREAKQASIAAREAAENASSELKSSYYRFALLDARRILAETRQWVLTRKWQIASVRANDLANQASQLAYSRPSTDDEWIQARDRLRGWASIFQAIPTNRNLDRPADDWDQLCAVLHDKIDRECGPFGITEEPR